jgi:hypothetical protein
VEVWEAAQRALAEGKTEKRQHPHVINLGHRPPGPRPL